MHNGAMAQVNQEGKEANKSRDDQFGHLCNYLLFYRTIILFNKWITRQV
jgi:hypothetical protein